MATDRARLSGRELFAAVAPRLERAHRLERAARAEARRARHRAREAELAAERLVAHRDLQLVRAYSVGDGRYIRRRERKLEQARAQLRRARARSKRLGA